jgi:hypothetical protein
MRPSVHLGDDRQRIAGVPYTPHQLGTTLINWLRLGVSPAVGGEWTTWGSLTGGAAPPSSGVRAPAVGAGSNGVPTAVFDGTDVMVWAIGSTNNRTTKIGYWLWLKPTDVTNQQRLLHINAGGTQLQFYINGSRLTCEAYISGGNGRVCNTPVSTLALNTWASAYLQYDSSRGGDDNLRIYVNGTLPTLTYAAIGAGGTLTTLPTVAGNIILGAATNTDTPVQALANGTELGQDLLVFGDNLTADQMAAQQAFDHPT